MSNNTLLSFLAALALAGGLDASSVSISTGQGSGPYDPIWNIYSVPVAGPGTVSGNSSGPAVVNLNPIWGLGQLADAHWIATYLPDPGASNYAGGNYIYEMQFFVSSGGSDLSFGVAADNAVNVFLDASASTLAAYGTSPCSVNLQGCVATWGDFNDIQSTGFSSFDSVYVPNINAGVHTLYLEVQNGNNSYMGAVVRGLLTGPGDVEAGVPEPASWTMLGAGITMLGAIRRRKNILSRISFGRL